MWKARGGYSYPQLDLTAPTEIYVWIAHHLHARRLRLRSATRGTLASNA